MMKHFIISALALLATLPAAINVKAQDDDDIYFSKKANKKATQEAIYAATEEFEWQTDANNDWDLDDYNRRGKESAVTTTEATTNVVTTDNEPAFYYEIPDGNGGTTKVAGNKKILKGSDVDKYKIINDTIVLVEQYYFSDRIRRFHNPFFSYFRYSPWYDVAFYDPFYWDYCYYDPWWYVTPSFGFHWGSWYGGWSFGYYTGWYGGWYSPFYHPMPHYYSYWDHVHYGPSYVHSTGGAHRGSSRNNFGGHFAHQGGWRRDGGSSRITSASSNRSYRAANGARTGRANQNGTYTAGPTLRGRNDTNGRIANSNMRSSSRTQHNANSSVLSRGDFYGANSGASSNHSAHRYNNSDTRRAEAGVRQKDNGSSYRRSESRAENRSYTPQNNNHSANRYNNGGSRSNETRSYNNSGRSSGNFGAGSGSHNYGGGHSGGGHSGGSHSGGGRAGRR